MATSLDKRIKDLTTETETFASDDYIVTDGETNGTRKMPGSALMTPSAVDEKITSKIAEEAQRSNAYADEAVGTLSGQLKSVALTGSYNDLGDKPTIPTKTSDLENDSGFITNVDGYTLVAGQGINISIDGNNLKIEAV